MSTTEDLKRRLDHTEECLNMDGMKAGVPRYETATGQPN